MVYATADGRAAEKLRVGMVGGGRNAFIGAVHRLAMRLDDQISLVAGGCPPIRQTRPPPRRKSASQRTAAMPISGRWPRPKASAPTASRR